MPVAEQVAIIFAVTKGYLDDVPLEDVRAFEKSFLEFARNSRPEVLQKIRDQKELTDEVSQALVDAVETFKKDFLPAAEGEAAA
jgi:F-type H+-transporting ATPase subunit alpha